MGKGEITHYEQFVLFPQCFQKACFQGASKGVVVWEWVKLPCQNLSEIIVWKRENSDEHDVLLPCQKQQEDHDGPISLI